jgi:aryl-alcohol dehydrogenase-like predicted oxidoreductase
MAEGKTTYTTQAGRAIAGYQGAQAGKGFASSVELAKKKADEDDWSAFARSYGLQPMIFSGLGGGTARSKYKTQFESWRAKSRGTIGDLIGGR